MSSAILKPTDLRGAPTKVSFSISKEDFLEGLFGSSAYVQETIDGFEDDISEQLELESGVVVLSVDWEVSVSAGVSVGGSE